jgi:hypothetical protein
MFTALSGLSALPVTVPPEALVSEPLMLYYCWCQFTLPPVQHSDQSAEGQARRHPNLVGAGHRSIQYRV